MGRSFSEVATGNGYRRLERLPQPPDLLRDDELPLLLFELDLLELERDLCEDEDRLPLLSLRLDELFTDGRSDLLELLLPRPK
jgi:hypothetical protein